MFTIEQNYLTSQTDVTVYSFPFFLVGWDVTDASQFEHRKAVVKQATKQAMGKETVRAIKQVTKLALGKNTVI